MVAYESDPWVYTSMPDSGYSLDNLLPTAPLELLGSTVGMDAQLDWMQPQASPDVVGYNLYRSNAPGVIAEPGNLLTTIPDLTYLDATTGGVMHYYVVTAIDDAEQEGPPSNEVAAPHDVGGVPTVLPRTLSLRAGGANPARERARFLYGLPADAPVSIAVFDVSGRAVHTESRNSVPAGWHTFEFERNAAPRGRVTSGVYFLEVRAGAERRTTRFVLLP